MAFELYTMLALTLHTLSDVVVLAVAVVVAVEVVVDMVDRLGGNVVVMLDRDPTVQLSDSVELPVPSSVSPRPLHTYCVGPYEM